MGTRIEWLIKEKMRSGLQIDREIPSLLSIDCGCNPLGEQMTIGCGHSVGIKSAANPKAIFDLTAGGF